MAKRQVMFTFPEELIKEPIIYNLSHQFKVVTNIRRADVSENKGWVVLELEGEEAWKTIAILMSLRCQNYDINMEKEIA